MIRIALMVTKSLLWVPTWFYHIWKYGRVGDTHTEIEKYEYLRMIVRKVNRAGRVKVEACGMENLPAENGFIFFPNHQGLFDMLAIIETCPRPIGVVVKKEAAGIILVKQVVEMLKGMSIDRSDVKGAMKIINQMTEEVKQGRNYVIFAEGTRSKNGNEILEFKGGTFKSAVNAGCPIVPVALIDSFRPFDISSIKKETVQVHYLPPIDPNQYVGMRTMEIAHLVHDKIEEKIRSKTG